MPIHEYKAQNNKGCDYCKPGFEYLHLSKDEDILKNCPECDEGIEKIISKSSFELKGDGWTKPSYNKEKNREKESIDTKSRGCGSCASSDCGTCGS